MRLQDNGILASSAMPLESKAKGYDSPILLHFIREQKVLATCFMSLRPCYCLLCPVLTASLICLPEEGGSMCQTTLPLLLHHHKRELLFFLLILFIPPVLRGGPEGCADQAIRPRRQRGAGGNVDRLAGVSDRAGIWHRAASQRPACSLSNQQWSTL